jgi:hypothetical protein
MSEPTADVAKLADRLAAVEAMARDGLAHAQRMGRAVGLKEAAELLRERGDRGQPALAAVLYGIANELLNRARTVLS